MSINSVTIVGNLTRDPELKALPTGTPVCELGVAVNERVKGQNGQWEDRPSFFDVSVFGGQAENAAKFLAKGRQVAITGRLRQERWKNQAGENRSRVRIVANEVQFIGGRDQQGEQQPAPDTSQPTWGGQQYPQQGAAQQPMGDFGGQPSVQQGPHTDPSDEIPFRWRGHEGYRYHEHNEFR